MPTLFQVARTISHLKPRQIAYQLIRRLGARNTASPVTGNVCLRQGVALSAPLRRRTTGDETTFTFLNITRRFDPQRFDWALRDMGKLWRYNLHYFDYLNEEGRSLQSKQFLLDSWIQNNPPGAADAWEPFPVSLRIVNWIKFFLSGKVEGKLEARRLKSLYEQALWLEKNIEYHLLANHYFKNGKALFFAGIFFDGADAERWLYKGMQLLMPELDEQMLPDGGHFERSPMYHAMILEDCLDVLNVCRNHPVASCKRFAEAWPQPVRGMMAFLLAMSHPDGQIALFNDAAFGIEASPRDLADYFERITGMHVPEMAAGACSFPDTGYFVMAPAAGDRLIVDCGPIGPDYQPGHSHCDTLSFELSLQGRRVIVDSGCCRYEKGAIRNYNRGNAGHNTITVDGRNQSEIWGAHRCGRRARPIAPRLYRDANCAIVFEGAHDGYRWLAGRPIHHRRVHWLGNEIEITDRIEGNGRHAIHSRLHLHPEMQVEFNGETVAISAGDRLFATLSAGGPGRIELQTGWYCPEFGLKQPCQVICLNHDHKSLPFKTGWRLTIPGKK